MAILALVPRMLRDAPAPSPSVPGRVLPRVPRSRTIPRAIVVGDLLLDVVVAPARPLERGTDVPGRVLLRQGGSAATTARWLARLGVRTSLVTAIGRDGAGRALAARMTADGVRLRAVRVPGLPTGRIAVVLDASGERSFVADRGAADRLEPGDLRRAWFDGLDLLHLPAYSLLTRPLADAARQAIGLARAEGALLSVDLASIGPLLAGGRGPARTLVEELGADILFATAAEARALIAGRRIDDLASLAPLAVVKRGPEGATVLVRDDGSVLRFDVATTPLRAADTTGAGDAFDAGFLAAWLIARVAGTPRASAVRRATVAGHRAASRQLTSPLPELTFA